MSKKALSIILLLFCAGVMSAARFQTPPETKAPSDTDQLVIVRISAALNDAISRRDKAQLEYNQAVRDIQDVQPQLQKAVDSARAKLPAAPAGQEWKVQPDGQLGIRFVLAPLTNASATAGPTPAASPAAAAQKSSPSPSPSPAAK
jgi:hypothetical protein